MSFRSKLRCLRPPRLFFIPHGPCAGDHRRPRERFDFSPSQIELLPLSVRKPPSFFCFRWTARFPFSERFFMGSDAHRHRWAPPLALDFRFRLPGISPGTVIDAIDLFYPCGHVLSYSFFSRSVTLFHSSFPTPSTRIGCAPCFPASLPYFRPFTPIIFVKNAFHSPLHSSRFCSLSYASTLHRCDLRAPLSPLH